MKYFSLFILVILVLSCTNGSDSAIEEQTAASENAEGSANETEFEVLDLKAQNFKEVLTVTGLIDVPPKYKTVISSLKAGFISKTPLLVGDKVEKGDFLVSLKNTEFVEMQKEYLKISEELDYLKEEFERKEKLFKENITSKKEYLRAKSNYRSSLANHEGLKKTLMMLNINPKRVEEGNFTTDVVIYAPIDGYVTKLNISQGSYVSADDVIMEIINTDHIHLELKVFEKDILKVKKDQDIKFTIPEASNQVFTAKVHLVGTTVGEKSRRVNVHAHTDDETNFIVGMYVNAKIMVQDKEGYGLPNEAILKDANGSYVYTLNPTERDASKAKKTYINTGIQNDTHTEVVNADVLQNKTIVSLN
jgi:cobalt-zinc-cadmium efflux system membrane fusion protein